MRHQTQELVKRFLDEHTDLNDVLEVGCRPAGGNENIAGLMQHRKYTGVDMTPGEGVTKVLNGHDLSKEFGEEFDIVFCFDTLEHDDKFWLTIEEMKKVLRPGGYLVLGVPGRYCPYHEHPHDYWRFMEDGVRSFFDDMSDSWIEVQKDDINHAYEDEIYGYAKKT